jgi:hypothetical protein
MYRNFYNLLASGDSKNSSYRTLRGVGSTSPLPAHRLHRLTGRRGGQGGLKPYVPDNMLPAKRPLRAYAFSETTLGKVAPAGQLSMPKLELQMPNSYRSEITNYKHQIPNKFQISNKIKSQLFGILNFGHCYLFVICVLLFEIFITET